jgi:hypothetical protein
MHNSDEMSFSPTLGVLHNVPPSPPESMTQTIKKHKFKGSYMPFLDDSPDAESTLNIGNEFELSSSRKSSTSNYASDCPSVDERHEGYIIKLKEEVEVLRNENMKIASENEKFKKKLLILTNQLSLD